MIRLSFTIAWLLCLYIPCIAYAQIDEQKDSADFEYLYEQDVDSSSQDEDGNTVSDFWPNNPDELPAIGGGLASFSDGDFYRSDFTDSITRTNFADNDTFTVEISARMLTSGSEDGPNGTMGIFWRDNGADEDTNVLFVGDDFVKTLNGDIISSADNTDDFHVFRIARDTDGEFWFWRDGLLLAQDVAAVDAAGADGLFVGDTGTTNQGDWEMDYMRLAIGGFAPVSKPGDFVPPASVDVFRGFQVGGDLSSFAESDDNKALFNPGFTLNSLEAPVWLIFDAAAPSAVNFLVESSAGTPGLTYTVEAWNWNANSYDEIGVQAESFNTDQVQTYPIVAVDHVDQAGNVRSRVGWRKTGLTINFPWEARVDQAGWNQ